MTTEQNITFRRQDTYWSAALNDNHDYAERLTRKPSMVHVRDFARAKDLEFVREVARTDRIVVAVVRTVA